MGRPALGQEGLLQRHQRRESGRQGAQGRLLVEEGVQIDEVGHHHPARTEDGKQQHVLKVGTLAPVDQHEGSGQEPKQQHLGVDGFAHGNAVCARKISGPGHGTLGIRRDLADAVERVAPGGGQAQVADRGVGPDATNPHPRADLGAHAPDLLPVVTVQRAVHEVDIVVVGLDHHATKGLRPSQVVLDERSGRGEARGQIGQPLVAIVAENTVGEAAGVLHAAAVHRPAAGQQILRLGHGLRGQPDGQNRQEERDE